MSVSCAPRKFSVSTLHSICSVSVSTSPSNRHTRLRRTPEPVISSNAAEREDTRMISIRRITAPCSEGVVDTAAQPVLSASAWDASPISRSGSPAEPASMSSISF